MQKRSTHTPRPYALRVQVWGGAGLAEALRYSVYSLYWYKSTNTDAVAPKTWGRARGAAVSAAGEDGLEYKGAAYADVC